MDPITAWAVTTGEAGMRAQARGLAHAAADAVLEFELAAAPLWRPGLGRWRERLRPSPGGGPPEGLPDLLVTCGRRSAAFSAALASEARGVVRAHIQDPRRSVADFDLVIVLGHDDTAAAPNVIETVTALHEITPERLAAGAQGWRQRFARLPRPLTGVAIGGPTRRSGFSRADGRRFIGILRSARLQGGLAITPSRRTPGHVRRCLARTFGEDSGVFIFDGAGDNPYLGILALSDRLLVTGDSVSMVSEALATGRPVQVFDTGEGRHQRFLDTLVGRGLASRAPAPAPPRTGPFDETPRAAAALRRLLQERRTGRSG
ncbi:MAG TPA: mitochondrial fission ELM1 family protein [Caulobacteraceae bacterium]|nr:mitochondrial fission ELM1 family protein [Caulobacteraceae bacterium]